MLDSYAPVPSLAGSTTVTPAGGQPLSYANSVGCLLADPAGYVLLRLHAGPYPVDYVQVFLTHTHHLLRRHGWQPLLAEQSGMNPFSPAEQAWIMNYWLARQQGEHYSMIGAVPKYSEALARFADLRQGVGLTYHGFPQQAAAMTWLCQPG